MTAKKRCPNGFHRNKKTGECEPKKATKKVKTVQKNDAVAFMQFVDPLLPYMNAKSKLQFLSTAKHTLPMNNIRKQVKEEIQNEIIRKKTLAVLKRAHKKESKGQRLTYLEQIYLRLVQLHSPGGVDFDDIVSSVPYGHGSYVYSALKKGISDGAVLQIKTPGVKTLYKGHRYTMTSKYPISPSYYT
jgi:hypothetical protein